MDDRPEPPSYRHTQTATTLLGLGLTALFGVTGALVALGSHPALLVAGLVVAGTLLLTHSLTVTVDSESIEVRWGNGLVRRRIRLADIEAVEPAQLPGAWAMPIRRTRTGWIHAVRGGDAVLMRLRDESTCVVGSDDALDLLLALRQRLPHPPTSPA